jgi:hypothetical protein
LNQIIALSPEAANVTDIHVQSLADSFKNIHANRVAIQQFSVCAVANSGQPGDILPGVTTPFKESP